MEFFDRKEDVMDIQLTPLGKRLMQLGQFKPKSYAFYDNDIMYNGDYAGTKETQNEIQERIKEVPRIKQQVYLYSAEGKIKSNTVDSEFMTFNENLFQDKSLTGTQTLTSENNLQREESLQRQWEMFGPLGDMSFHADLLPVWNIDFYDAELTGSVIVATGSNNERIPGLRCDPQFKFVLKKETPEQVFTEDGLWTTKTPPTQDGTYLSLKPQALFIKISEKNTHFLNDNVDIEVYRVLSDGEEQQLYFNPPGGSLVGSPQTVDYWFDILIDSEIQDEKYCEAVRSEKLESTYTDKFIFDCEDLKEENVTVNQIYDIPDEEVEICD